MSTAATTQPVKKKRPKYGGRTKGTPNKSTQLVKEVIDEVSAKHGGMQMLVERLFELVNGVLVKETNSKGEPNIYQKAPDTQAARLLLEYRYGKAPAYLDVTSKGERVGVKIVEDLED